MRYVSPATLVVFLSGLAPGAMFGQIVPANLSVTNYRFVSEDRVDRTHSIFTYNADLVNKGPAIPAVTATVQSLLSTIVVQPGLGNLHFPPTPAGGLTSSTNTFSLLVDRTGNTDFSNLEWSFVAPVANPGPNQTGATGVTVTLNGSGSTNPIGIGSLQYFWTFTSSPQGSAAVLQGPATVSPTFVPDIQGVYVVLLYVSNGLGSDTASVTVTVGPGNTPPVAVAGPDQKVSVGATVTLNGSGSHDVDGDPLTYSWTLITRPAGSSATLTGATTVSPTFVADKAGQYVAQLVVNDGKVNSLPANVTISTIDTAPVANAGPNQAVAAPGLVQLDGSASTDADGDPLTYRWSLLTVPAGSVAVLNNPAAVRPTFTADVAGTYIAQLIVNDGTFDSVPSTVTITVGPGNTPPVAVAGPNQAVKAGATVVLNGSGSHDVDGDPLTFSWSLVTRPAGSIATLTGATTVSASFVADKVGQYVAQLIVNDGKVNSVPSTVTISSNETPPVANAGPNQVVNVGALVQLDGSGSTDVDGDPLTYRWSLTSRPTGSAAALNNAAAVKPTFTADIAGTYIAQLIVNDGFVDSAPATVTITSNQPLQPTANAGPNQTVARGALVTLSGSGTDPQGLPLTFQWSLTSRPVGSTAALSSTTIANPTFVADLPGTYLAQLIVNNGTLSSVPSTVTIKTTNTQPVANAGQSRFVATTSTVTLDGTGSSDADNDPLTYSWSFLSRPAGSAAVLAGSTTPTPTFTADVAGTYVVQLIVNDGFVDSNPSTVTITAGANPITLTPNPLNLSSNAPGTLTITLATAPAPGSGGQVIALSVFDSSVVTAPPTVTVPAGSTSTTATITPLKPGSTTIFATASGFQPGSVAVNVGQPGIAVTLSSSSVGVTKTVNGTITLTAPAPGSGITVALGVDNSGIVTLPPSVSIAGGAATGTFTVTGVKSGTVLITASSAGYASGSVPLSVVDLGAITLQSNAVVAPGQTLPFGVSLVTVAPVGGVTITLTSSDTGTLTVSPTVFIPGGATTPTTPAQITGVNFGSATISASAGGFTGDSKTVQVAANLSFSQASFTIGTGVTNLTLSLTGAAPQGGVTVNLTSSNPSIASVPGTVSIAPNTSSTTVPVTGVAVGGPVTITAASSVAGIANATVVINVVPGVSITTSTLPSGTVNTPYNFQVLASGGVAPLTFTATGLPAGLSISAAGLITGTPSAAGTSTAAITVTDSNPSGHATATVNLPITIVTPLAITPLSLPAGVVGTAYAATAVNASGGTAPYSFTATGLPAGLSISAAGVITGTPSAAGTSTAVITVTDSTNPSHLSTTANLSITVVTPLSITTTTLPGGIVGAVYTATTVNATGGTTPYSFTATGLPAGLSISAAGQITGTPTGPAGTATAAITVTDSTNPTAHLTATANLSITIGPGLSITTTPLPGGIVGAVYTATTVAAIGGTSPYSFTATGLPAGLSISAAGQITGTPNGPAGTATAAITVTDSTNPTHLTATANLSIVIGTTVAITTTSLPGGIVGVAYTATTVNATGGTGPYTFTATGLPAGLSISAAGQITGTPTGPAGTATAAITVTDSTNPTHLTATANLSIVIGNTVAITTTSLPGGIVGVAYPGATVTATGGTGPYTFTATGLPAGLSISAAGQITGTPSGPGGTSTAAITVTDSTNPTHLSATANLPITIIPALAITTTTLPGGIVGVVYTAPPVAATGGTLPYTFTATGLPAGLSISAAGAITGTPSGPAGTSTATITVTDSTNPTLTATANLQIVIGQGVAITTTSLPPGIVGVPYSAPLVTATGGTAPYTFTATGLPAGLSISAAGQIAGTPIGPAGTSSGVITVTDSTNPTHLTATATLSIVISPPPLQITPPSLPNGNVGIFYSTPVTATGGTPPLTFSASGLPAGLAIAPSTGVISGTPQVTGTSLFSISVTDSTTPVHQTATLNNQSLTIVLPSGPFISALVPNVTVGQNLETPITFRLSAASSNPVTIFVSSDSPNVLLIDARTPDAVGCVVDQNGACVGRASITLPPGFTDFTVLAQGLASSGVATLTASASGYGNGTAQVTLAPSGFVLAGPNGVGVSFVSNPGVGSQLAVTAERLDGAGVPVEIQPVRAFFLLGANGLPILDGSGKPIPAGPLAVTLTNSNGSIGQASAQVSISAGTDTGLGQFMAFTTPGSTVVTAIAPPGFSTPAGGVNSVGITVQLSQISVGNTTVGQGLEAISNFMLQGAPLGNTAFLVTSRDPSKLLLSNDATSAGSPVIIVTIPLGFSNSPDYYVYGVGNSGTVGYTVCQSNGAPVNPQCASNPVFGSADGSVTLSKSGFVLQSSFGLGADFFTTTLSPNSDLTVLPALLSSAGAYISPQALAGGTSASVSVTSANTIVGTITTSPVTITGGSNGVVTQFTPKAQGSTLIAVSTPPGFSTPTQFASLNATVSLPRITLDSSTMIGNNLQATNTIFLSVPAPPGLTVTITATGSISLSSTATGPGAAQITVSITAGSNIGNYFTRGLASSGTASVSGTAPGYLAGSGTDILSPSSVVIGGPGGPGTPFPDTISLTGGNAPITINTAVLDQNGNFVQTQPLAGGGASLSITVNNQNTSVGTLSAPLTITGGSDTVVGQFTPKSVGQTTLTVATPSGFTPPPTAYASVVVKVQ
jgi:Putative Ig domain/PKD domain